MSPSSDPAAMHAAAPAGGTTRTAADEPSATPSAPAAAARAWRLRLGLSQRLWLVFAVLLLACCGASAWLQLRASGRHEQEVTQRLSRGLAAHIAGNAALMERSGLNDQAVRALFGQLMAVNPSVEVYLLGLDGRIVAQAAPPGHIKQARIDLAPIRQFLADAPLPILGDDPRGEPGARKVFSAAPLRVDGAEAGYVYVVLSGEDREAIVAHAQADEALRTTLRSMALVALLGLAAGFAALRLVTRPLRELTRSVLRFDVDGAAPAAPAAPSRADEAPREAGSDEIAALNQAFAQMTARIGQQWKELTAQDRQRRELFANISHDLRTPLTSLHGYLETLRLKDGTLTADERGRYLETALGQSRKVGRLAQELFELARLEYGVVKLEKETFVLADLVQDVLQKFELAAEARHTRLHADIADALPPVTADLGLIERVLTNLLDNAIRHTPESGEVTIALRHGTSGGVEVEVSDTGPGIPATLRPILFTRPAFSPDAKRSGGLGLVIVQRILQLHGSGVRLGEEEGKGAVFVFELN